MKPKDKKLARDFLDALDDTIRVKRQLHPAWQEYLDMANKRNTIFARRAKMIRKYNSILGKYRYFYTNSNGSASLVKLNYNIMGRGSNFATWEVYFSTGAKSQHISRKQAEKQIEQHLRGKIRRGYI